MTMSTEDEDTEASDRREPVTHETTGTVRQFEETLSVEKRRIPVSTKRIEKEVLEHTETVSGTLTHAMANIKRVARNTTVDGERPTTQQIGNTIIIPVLEERVVVKKELVLLEEIYVTVDEELEPFSESMAVRKDVITITDKFDDGSA